MRLVAFWSALAACWRASPGYTEVPTIQVSHLSDAQKTAFAIADNQLATTRRSCSAAE